MAVYNTSPLSGSWQDRVVENYATTAPALSAEMLGGLRRSTSGADAGYQSAIARQAFGTSQARISAATQREAANRGFKRTGFEMMRNLGGAGLARSGLFAGRNMRELSEDLRLRYGEIDAQMAAEIAALMQMVNEARMARDMTYADAAEREALLRSNPSGLLPAAGMVR